MQVNIHSLSLSHILDADVFSIDGLVGRVGNKGQKGLKGVRGPKGLQGDRGIIVSVQE